MDMQPEAWGFFGVLVTGILAILGEQIRSRRKTEDVKQEVIETKDSNGQALELLAQEISIVKERIDDHIRWHLEESRHIRYIPPREYRS